MVIRSVLIVMVIALLPATSLQADGGSGPTHGPSSYIKLEVQGKLLQKGPTYYVETYDATFTDQKLLVGLERSEDKNRALDRHLEELKGRSVIARGFLDCRRVGQEAGVIYLYLINESQVTAAGDK